MAVRAIFYVDSIEVRGHDRDDDGNPIRTGIVKLRAAVKGPYANWARYSPHGELTLGTLNPSALAWFEERLGTDVALTFDDPTDADLAVE